LDLPVPTAPSLTVPLTPHPSPLTPHPLRLTPHASLLRVIGRALRPTLTETRSNPRARSAVLRAAERLA